MKNVAEVAYDLGLILDFVERHNKQDTEKDVAQAAANIEVWLATYEPEHDPNNT